MRTFSDYVKRMLQNQPEALDEDTELALIARAQHGDDEAYEALLLRYMKLIAGNAMKFFSDSMEPDDLFQEGCKGFRNAVMKFDASHHCRLSTYASQWIVQAMSRAIQDCGRTIRIPEHVQTDYNRLKRAKAEFLQEYGFEPNEEELSDYTHMKPEKVREIFKAFEGIDSLDRELSEEGETVVGAFVSGDIKENPETVLIKQDRQEKLFLGIQEALDERERTIICRRNGLYGAKEETLDEIGKDLGITRERVRQLEKQAMQKLANFEPLNAA